MVQPVPETIDFPTEEKNVLQLWNELDAFQFCLKQSKGKPRYSFYDGPPFATGMPHYGHLLAGSIKDVVTRYAHQNGYHVERRFGWDTHGLPVEYEIDKTLGIKGPDDIAKMGIANYNAQCRSIVMRYAKEWEFNFTPLQSLVDHFSLCSAQHLLALSCSAAAAGAHPLVNVVWRLGRWMDFKNDYKTMYPWYMESVWWAFKQLFDKGLVYKGFKVMPFSTACNTPLSNFESGQNYKDVIDPAVIVSFPLEKSPEVSLVAWTTTPWTLPSNLALVVNPEKDYVKVKDAVTEKIYVLMEARLEALYKSTDSYVVLDRFKGVTLKDKSYVPPFSYFSSFKKNGAFCILNDTYVTEESGTGIVHSAPFFGEEDYRVCLAAGIISKAGEMACPVDSSGRFLDPVVDFKGEYVKDADKNIIKWLKNADRLVHQGSVKHSYPFCWRSDTPLIYKAVPSWFIRVEVLSQKLLETNDKTYWVPTFVKEKRFANWLKDARDWAVSRNRYWGTPIPLWSSEDGMEIVCIGSIQELEQLSGSNVSDLHREYVDPLTIPSAKGNGILHRVTEVFDCWFESGSMPFAQAHYPFENKKAFEGSFPADFVAEGIDQTRGWFYTLQVLATALFGEPAFKNLISNGLILASDGQKMSKRKQNYPDPLQVIDKCGADALRLYLINSPAVRADNLRFKEEGVRDVLKDVLLPWYNAYRFLVQNIERVEKEEGIVFSYNEQSWSLPLNIMDRWIISYMQSLISSVKKEMAAYKLYNVVPQLVKFVDNLTNWYVRVMRRRLKGEDGKDDCVKALETLFSILFTMIRVMASFVPFLTEHMYQNLRRLVANNAVLDNNSNISIHFLMFPEWRSSFIDEQTERAVAHMQIVIELGRVIRDRKTIPIKYPLPEIVVIHKDEECLDDIRSLEKYILLELNVRTLTMTTDKKKFGVILRAEPDHKTLGARLKSSFKPLVQAIKDLNDDQLQAILKRKEFEIQGHVLNSSDLRIMYSFTGETSKGLGETYEADAKNEVLVLLNVKPDKAMVDEGVAREVINRIQKLKKKLKLVPLDKVTIFYLVSPSMDPLAAIVLKHKEYIANAVRSVFQPLPHPPGIEIIAEHSQELKNAELKLVIAREFIKTQETSIETKYCDESFSNFVFSTNGVHKDSTPCCRYTNVILCGPLTKESCKGTQITLLLENPIGCNFLNFQSLVRQVQIGFGLQGCNIKLVSASADHHNIDSTVEIITLHGKILYALRLSDNVTNCLKASSSINHNTFSRYVNVAFNFKAHGFSATIFLENPTGIMIMDMNNLKLLIAAILKKPSDAIKLYNSAENKSELNDDKCVFSLHGKTLLAVCN